MNSIPKTLSPLTDYLTQTLPRYTSNLRHLQQIHAQILTNGLLNSIPLLTNFLSCTYHSNNPYYTMLFLRNLPSPSPLLYNSMIKVSLESDNHRDFIRFYYQFRYHDLVPNKTTLSLILRSCAKSGAIHLGKSFHCEIVKVGFEFDVILQTGLLDFYGKIGDLRSASNVFAEMPNRDVIANNAMVSAFGKHGCVKEAKELFDSMVEKNACSWNSMISCYCKTGDIGSARAVFDCNPMRDVVSWNTMIDGYCKLGLLTEAEELFARMGVIRNAVTWNTMIGGYVQCGNFRRAINVFQEMLAKGVNPTEVTMISLLSACAQLGALDMGEWIHSYIKKRRLRLDVVLGNALIDMYCKCGIVDAALDVFQGLRTRNIFCWNSIIVGLGMHGYGNKAIDLFTSMEKEGIKPDNVTFVGLLSACSHSGLVSTGKSYFSLMQSIYSVQPGIEHYGCMVDLLGRSGYLEEALELVGTMPMQPNVVVWGSLLRACHMHKNTTIGERVTQHLLELDPRDGGNYVFLSNLYASLQRWSDVDMCRKLMMERGVHKTPGCSSIEVDNVVHEFIAGDNSHPQFPEINEFLEEISKQLISYGYEPDTTPVLHDIEEEEKESAVRYHSERIAVAFGLMRVPPGKVIRIVKNLRTCNDCHSAIKVISKVYGRVIIMRDRNRFHHFENGSCSCNDYW